MSIENIIRAIAGTFILVTLALGVAGSPLYVSSYFLWGTAFVGFNLFQSGFTNFCPLVSILKKLGVNRR